ncbi:hypothetical protein JST97_33010 [bacterium]|nr:hypothetical protein [bacterium]
MLLIAGVPAKVVAERLGHASVTQTLDTYSHVLPALEYQATDELRNLLYRDHYTTPPQLPPGDE